MPEQARVTSVEAIDQFRSALVVYLTAVRPLLEEATTDLRRMRVWLDTHQRGVWETELRRRARRLDEARQELFSARLSSFREATAEHQMAVHRAQREVGEAEEKLRRVKYWTREFGNRADVLARPVGVLEGIVSQDMAKALAWLTEVVRILEDYAELRKRPDKPVGKQEPVIDEPSEPEAGASPGAQGSAGFSPPQARPVGDVSNDPSAEGSAVSRWSVGGAAAFASRPILANESPRPGAAGPAETAGTEKGA